MSKKRDNEGFEIKPAGAYLDIFRDFAEMLGDLNSEVIGREKTAPARESGTGVEKKPAGASEKAAAFAEAAEKTEGPVKEEKPDLEALLKELDGLVGLEKVKENVKSLVNLVKVRKLERKTVLPCRRCPSTWCLWAIPVLERRRWPA